MRDIESWVGGASLAAQSTDWSAVCSPVTGEQVTRVAMAGSTEVDTAVAAAKSAGQIWSAMSATQRGRILTRIATALRERADDFIDAECAETGKVRAEMAGSLETAAEYFEYYGSVCRAFFGDGLDLGAAQHAFTRREPFGVVGIITPWNGPLTQAARGAAAALAAGNCVVMKPATFTSTTTVMLARLCEEHGLPPGVFNVVTGSGRSVGEPLVTHPDVALVAFTGSVETGRTVASMAAHALKPTIMELGGKSPNIVFEDADLDRAALSATTIRLSTGQQCAALSRLLVSEAVAEQVTAKVVNILEKYIPGVNLGPVTTASQYAKVVEYFGIAADDGAQLRLGGSAATDGDLAKGYFVEPTVYSGVTADMRIFREEIFGPVLAISTFRDEAEAIRLANDSEFGLVASVWTRDASRALRVASAIKAGQVMVNGGKTGVETPFGGYKASGWGREKGFDALSGYTQLKTTVINLD